MYKTSAKGKRSNVNCNLTHLRGDNVKKKIISLVTALALIVSMLFGLSTVVKADDSGSCGTRATYTFDEATGVLTVSGSGNMRNYSNAGTLLRPPWYDYKADITKVVIENDIEKVSNERVKYRNSYKIGSKIKDLNSLNKGDYVVHMAHGIGIYNGIKTLTKRGLAKDYIEILYADNDKVYVPVEKMNTILKYTSKDGFKPKINKLNSTGSGLIILLKELFKSSIPTIKIKKEIIMEIIYSILP